MQPLPSALISAAVLTEDDVKQRFVPFLKDFYRHRYEPLPNTVEVDFDSVGEGGIVADGRVQFRKPDGSLFTCTYEATSRDKMAEVKFTLNLQYFLWDCAAFAAVAAAAAYIVFYNTRFAWLVGLHWPGNLGLLLGMGTIGFLGWYFTMQRWRKYRFIHAIAQFQQYYADDQWIALSEDVFPSPVDPYLQELRSQCTYHGFGLAVVPAEGNVRPIVNPSRLDLYGKDRAMVQWVTRAQWYQSATEGMGTLVKVKPPDALQSAWNKIARPVQHLVVEPFKKMLWSALTKPFAQANSPYTRFMRGRATQKWIFSMALLTISPLMYQVMSVRQEDLADIEALRNWRGDERNPEDQPGYIIDGEAIPYNAQPTGVPKQYPVRAEREEEVPTIDLSGSDSDDNDEGSSSGQSTAPNNPPPTRYEGIEDEPEPPKPAAKPKPKPANPAPASPRTVAPGANPCGRFSSKSGWVIQENAFKERSNAEERVGLLKRKKISAEMVARTCLDSGKSGYVVLLGGLFSDKNAAQAKLDDYIKTYPAQGLGKASLLLRQL